MKECEIEGCNRPIRSSNVVHCHMHYMQVRQYGRIMEVTRNTPNEFVVEGDICKIGLRNINHETIAYAIIDTEDMDKAKGKRWHIKDTGYATCASPRVKLHQLIMDTRLEIDHINNDRLDNRKANLRLATRSQNRMNSKPQKQGDLGIKGVRRHRGGYEASITYEGKYMYLGIHKTAKIAAEVYNTKARELFSEFAYQNPITD